MKNNRTNRRYFLKQTAFAAAIPVFVPSSVFGKNAPSNRVNIGCIGVGGRGKGLMRNTLSNDQARVIAVSDCFESRRQSALEMIKQTYAKNKQTADAGAKAYADFRELLKRDDIDGVIIATPDHWHMPIAFAAVEAGKDIYVEKPLGLSLDHGFKLRKLVQDKKAIFQYGTQQRSDHYFRFACELARNGYIGEIKSIDVWSQGVGKNQYTNIFPPTQPVPTGFDYQRWLGPAPDAPYSDVRVSNLGAWHIYDYALGFIAGWGSHPLDIAQWGNNTDTTAPIHYEGEGKVPAGGLFDTVSHWDIHCKYANGVKMHFMDVETAKPEVSKYFPKMRDHGTTFHGSEGWVSVRRGTIDFSNEAHRRVKIKDSEKLYQSSSQVGNFIDCIKTREKPISTIESAVQSDLISHLSNAVVRLGKPIKWDASKEQVIGDPETAKFLNRKLPAQWAI